MTLRLKNQLEEGRAVENKQIAILGAGYDGLCTALKLERLLKKYKRL